MSFPLVLWPLGLTIVRLLLGPIMLGLSIWGTDSAPWLVGCLYVAIASDIFDGILARRVGVASPALRRFDSQTDLVFWLCVLGCAWELYPDILLGNVVLIALMILMEAATYVLSFLKLGREPCTHAYLAKAWGLVLVGVFTAILGFGEGRISVPVLFFTYLIAFADSITILLLLPKWQCDVPSCYHAWLIRRNIPFRKHRLFH